MWCKDLPKNPHPFSVSYVKEPTYISALSQAVAKKPKCRKNEWNSGVPSENARKERQQTRTPLRSTIENDRGGNHNNKVSVCLSRLTMTVYSLGPSKALTYFILHFSLFGYHSDSVVANKLSYQTNQQIVFSVCHFFFIMVRLPRGPTGTKWVVLHP